MLGCGSPPNPACGGLATAIDGTPATWAGTTFISTLDASGASPPGTYRPTRPTGTSRCSTTAPGASSTRTGTLAASASATLRRRSMASVNAARTSGASPAAASAKACAGTRKLSGTTWSKRSEYSASAASPRSATAWTIGRTCATAASTSNSARGRTPR